MNKLLIICGATCTGKTSLAIDCALKLNTDVVSADSQLIYRNLNIGTAKPTVAEMRGVKHHMIDIVSPDKNFSVSDYVRLSEAVIDKIDSENKIPVVCGGTGFYIKSLIYDLSYGHTPADEGIRQKYAEILNEKGKEYLYNLLKKCDNETAAKLHINDTKRVIRALEIYEISGKRKSDIHDGFKLKRAYSAFAIDYPREQLYGMIDKRVDLMFDKGLVDEVENLLRDGINENNQCMQAIGYKEVLFCLKNGDNQNTMRDIIKQNTRHYAKRQITFFKKLDGIIWLKPEEANCETVLELYNE